jgi:hypothetical protein
MRAAVDRLAQRVESVEASMKVLTARKSSKRWSRRSKVPGARQKNAEEDINTASYAVFNLFLSSCFSACICF